MQISSSYYWIFSLSRIFTDIPLSSLELSGASYYFCDKCRAWRHVTNVHCDSCATCPSKDGRTYVHCGLCGRCVKPTYEHCLRCGRCCLPGHSCSKDRVGGAETRLEQVIRSKEKQEKNKRKKTSFKPKHHFKKSKKHKSA